MNLLDILQSANLALRILQARLVTLIALLLTFIMFAVAMWLQTVLGAIIASVWGLSIFLPVLFTGRGGHDGSQVSQGSQEHAAGEAPEG
jgi:hypothetical protein